MPINHKPVVENQGSDKKENPVPKGKHEIEFYISEPRYSFEQVILPEEVQKDIDRLLSMERNQDKIFNIWRLESVIPHHNLSVNLYGPSGTGKTMTAHAIAKSLGKKIIIVNYAEIESKYVGETSKNLVRLFHFAEENDAIILFDEADALLSKRVTEMNTAADVSVNQTRNTLLKILDEYKGIVLFTTNFIGNFDSAFMRRIFTSIKFPMPDRKARELLWNHYLLKTLPVDNRDELIQKISNEEGLTGADIANIVLDAAIEAADKDTNIGYVMIKAFIDKKREIRSAIDGNLTISTRKVSREYALAQMGKSEGEENGIPQRS